MNCALQVVLAVLGFSSWLAYCVWSSSGENALPTLPLRVTLAPNCHELPRSRQDQQVWNIEESGKFCLTQDFSQPTLWAGGHSWPRYGHVLMRLSGGEVTIDLQGHRLSAESLSAGIVAVSAAEKAILTRLGQAVGRPLISVTIRNGSIDLQGPGNGITLLDRWKGSPDSDPRNLRSGYFKTSHTLENLVIRTRGIGLIVEGEGNVIRNCVVESSGDAAIVVIGPNNLVENNRIVLAPQWRRPRSLLEITRQYPADHERTVDAPIRAALVLRDASGTRVSGNQIEVSEPSAKRVAIRVRDESRAVILESNLFLGPSEIGWAEPGVTVIDRLNRYTPR